MRRPDAGAAARGGRWVLPGLAVLLALAAVPVPGAAQALPDAQALMRRVDELWRGKSSRAQITMVVKTERYERTMTMEAWSEGQDKSLMVVLAPKKDRGIATLKVDRNIWNYLPKINRVTKIPPSMMMGAWMGSHFTNDDIVKESSFEEDYASRVTYAGERGGQPIYEVTSQARPEAAVVWGKVITEIAQESLMPVRAVYFDEDGKKAREMVFTEPRRFGGRTLPTRLVLRPEDKPGEHTTVIYDAIDFDVKLPPERFTLRGLQGR